MVFMICMDCIQLLKFSVIYYFDFLKHPSIIEKKMKRTWNSSNRKSKNGIDFILQNNINLSTDVPDLNLQYCNNNVKLERR